MWPIKIISFKSRGEILGDDSYEAPPYDWSVFIADGICVWNYVEEEYVIICPIDIIRKMFFQHWEQFLGWVPN
jgi:hypothetical protein